MINLIILITLTIIANTIAKYISDRIEIVIKIIDNDDI